MKPPEDDGSEEEKATCHALEEAETSRRRYPTRNRRQASVYEAFQGVSKTKTNF